MALSVHPPEQGTLVKGGIVYHDMLTHPDVSGTLTKQSSRSWADVKSQQLSTMILKLIAGTLLYNNEN